MTATATASQATDGLGPYGFCRCCHEAILAHLYEAYPKSRTWLTPVRQEGDAPGYGDVIAREGSYLGWPKVIRQYCRIAIKYEQGEVIPAGLGRPPRIVGPSGATVIQTVSPWPCPDHQPEEDE